MFTLWEDEAAIRRFAGEDMKAAKYYDFDAEYLLEMEPEVTHFGVVVELEPPGFRHPSESWDLSAFSGRQEGNEIPACAGMTDSGALRPGLGWLSDGVLDTPTRMGRPRWGIALPAASMSC